VRAPRAHIVGGDGFGWALDEDLEQTRQALDGVVELVDLPACDVVHSMWWGGLAQVGRENLTGKRVICNLSGHPARYLAIPEHRHSVPLVSCWLARSRQAFTAAREMGFLTMESRYTVDTTVFKPLPMDRAALRRRWGVPTDAFVVGNFQRDTEGADLSRPKLVKGPDIFLEMLRLSRASGVDLHVLLAGPRRHWLRSRLIEDSIPFTYLGDAVAEDDIRRNLHTREELNEFYALCDIHVVSSRSEGGPHALLEAAAACCPVISTPVGIAPELLDPHCVYRTVSEGAGLLREAERGRWPSALVEHAAQRVESRHTPDTVRADPRAPRRAVGVGSRLRRAVRRLAAGGAPVPLRVGLWHTFHKPPWGGGNQFLMALGSELEQGAVRLVTNRLRADVDVYLLNSVHFDVESFLRFKRDRHIRVVHRIDGPIQLIRGHDDGNDDRCFELNAELADATVVQSHWSYRQMIALGYRPVKPVLVYNAANPAIFHSRGRRRFSRDRKVRIIASSWSDNSRKGGATYKWLEENLDWDRFEFTFVGRTSVALERACCVDAVPSETLAELLREHDIYITASHRDPCSNALIEALSCGLPAIYHDGGGHPELVGHGGLGFREPEEIPSLLDAVVEHYETFQRLIAPPRMSEVAAAYARLLEDVAGA
jgi:glycosyltransferase involved in cell wall biosynthesis